MPTKSLRNKSPMEVLLKEKTDYKNLRAFRCLYFAHLRPYNIIHTSWISDPHLVPFLGYEVNQKGYKCLDSNGKLFISRHVVLNEKVFPFRESNIKLHKRYTIQQILFLQYYFVLTTKVE